MKNEQTNKLKRTNKQNNTKQKKKNETMFELALGSITLDMIKKKEREKRKKEVKKKLVLLSGF